MITRRGALVVEELSDGMPPTPPLDTRKPSRSPLYGYRVRGMV